MRILGYVLLITILVGCKRNNGATPVQSSPVTVTSASPIHPGDSVTYLAMGDSYTFGAGLDQSQSYPYQLSAELRNENYRAADPVVIASVGWTAADLLQGISSYGTKKKFDLVTILIGVNDQNKGHDVQTYTLQFDQILTDAIAYANGFSNRVFVISIPDWSVTPFAADMDQSQIKSSIELFNSVNEAESRRMKVNYLDIFALSESAANDPTLTGPDGLHPTAKMYALWINQVHGDITATFN